MGPIEGMENPILVCRHCRAVLAEGAVPTRAVADVVPAVGLYYVRGALVDRYSEPVQEDLVGWYVFNPANAARDLGRVGERRYCRYNHFVGRVDPSFEGDVPAIRFDPDAVVLVDENAYVRR